MSDDELYEADLWIDAGRTLRAQIDAVASGALSPAATATTRPTK